MNKYFSPNSGEYVKLSRKRNSYKRIDRNNDDSFKRLHGIGFKRKPKHPFNAFTDE